MLKIAVIGVLAAVLSAWIKTVKSEYALWVILLAGVFLGLAALTKLETILSELQFWKNYF